jgi:hypothetical protein
LKNSNHKIGNFNWNIKNKIMNRTKIEWKETMVMKINLMSKSERPMTTERLQNRINACHKMIHFHDKNIIRLQDHLLDLIAKKGTSFRTR